MCRECIIPLMLDLSFALHIALILVHPQSFILYASATQATPTNACNGHQCMLECARKPTRNLLIISICVLALGLATMPFGNTYSSQQCPLTMFEFATQLPLVTSCSYKTQQPIISKTNQKAWDETHQLKASACHPWTQSTSKMLKSTPLLFLKWSPFGNHKGQNNV